MLSTSEALHPEKISEKVLVNKSRSKIVAALFSQKIHIAVVVVVYKCGVTAKMKRKLLKIVKMRKVMKRKRREVREGREKLKLRKNPS